MNEDFSIVNKVAGSGLVSLDLADFYHHGERVLYDIKDNLYMGLMLKEKDFREFLKENDWSVYKDKNVAIICSEDAIVPTWAYMLLSIKMQPYANHIVFGNLEMLENSLFQKALNKIDVESYRDLKIVVKGCGEIPVPVSAFVQISALLSPVVASLMYGEPCSTVPLYKKPKV